MNILHIVEASDFSLEMDEAIEICGHKLFDITAHDQDYLEFPIFLSPDAYRDLSINELEAYLLIRKQVIYLLQEDSAEEVELPEIVLLQNYVLQ